MYLIWLNFTVYNYWYHSKDFTINCEPVDNSEDRRYPAEGGDYTDNFIEWASLHQEEMDDFQQ